MSTNHAIQTAQPTWDDLLRIPLDIIKWTWEHRDIIGGMTFLPAYDALYAQMPYVEITAEEYAKLAPAFPEIDFSKLYYYEEEDLTTAAQELACLAGSCEVDYGVGQAATTL